MNRSLGPQRNPLRNINKFAIHEWACCSESFNKSNQNVTTFGDAQQFILTDETNLSVQNSAFFFISTQGNSCSKKLPTPKTNVLRDLVFDFNFKPRHSVTYLLVLMAVKIKEILRVLIGLISWSIDPLRPLYEKIYESTTSVQKSVFPRRHIFKSNFRIKTSISRFSQQQT